MGCSLDRGLLMLPNNASRAYAKRHQVSNCAYLLPKEQLVSAVTTTASVVAIANSVGGKYNATRIPRDCRIAVETADHVAFRDLAGMTTHSHIVKATSRPDSAVLTSLLFHDTIEQYGNMGQVKQVRNETGGTLLGYSVERDGLVLESSRKDCQSIGWYLQQDESHDCLFPSRFCPSTRFLGSLSKDISQNDDSLFHFYHKPRLVSSGTNSICSSRHFHQSSCTHHGVCTCAATSDSLYSTWKACFLYSIVGE